MGRYATFAVLAGADPSDDPPVAPLPYDRASPAGLDIYQGNLSFPPADAVDVWPLLLRHTRAHRGGGGDGADDAGADDDRARSAAHASVVLSAEVRRTAVRAARVAIDRLAATTARGASVARQA